MLLGLLAPAPAPVLPAANGIVPLIRTGAALAPRLVGPLAPAVPVLGRSGAGLAILASFAIGFQVGQWLWGLLNGRLPVAKGLEPGLILNNGPQDRVWVDLDYTIIRDTGRTRQCDQPNITEGTVESFPFVKRYHCTRIEMLKTYIQLEAGCTGVTTSYLDSVGMTIYGWNYQLMDNAGATAETGYKRAAYESLRPYSFRFVLNSYKVNGEEITFPEGPDPNWRPFDLPEILPAPPPPLPLPEPDPAPPLPQAPPGTEPLPEPAPDPGRPVAPPIAPPVAPPTTQPRPPVKPTQPTRPTVPILPDGTPQPEPEPPPTQRPPGVETIPGGEVGSPGQKPRADLEGIAAEVGRIEGKVLKVLENQERAGEGSDLLKLLEELKKLLEDPFPAGSYELFPVCETDANGQPRPPMVAEWTAGTGANAEINKKLDALADLIQFHKELRQPVCNRAPIGEEVTVNFREDPETAQGATLLRKVLRYRDRTGASVATHAAHWEGFEWDAGPVIVGCNGQWGCVKVWASSTAEGQRVVRHALAAGGWNPDGDPSAEWFESVDSGGRNGRSGRMLVAVDLQGLRVTKRRGSSGPPEQVLPS